MGDVLSCELSKPVVSLSGAVTMLLEELELISDSNLRAISKFHPINSKIKKTKIAGGVFLSRKTLEGFKDHLIFYDQSRELNQLFKKYPKIRATKVVTRDLTPFAANNVALELLKPILKGCTQRVATLKDELSKVEKSLDLSQSYLKTVFYLGEIKDKKPNMVIAQDGFILSLKTIKGFKTYPSKLAYVPWSKRVLNSLVGFKHIGLSDGKANDLKVENLTKNQVNIYFRGVFIPGIRQIRFLESLQKLAN